MRRPNDDNDALALSTSFDRRPLTTRILELQDPIVSTDTAVTADGVRLALKRYTPRRHQQRSISAITPRNPVILCHGLAGNSTPFDSHRQNSLAWALCSQQGHTVWLANLRGAGESDRPAGGWTLDDYVHRDVPALIHHVRRAHHGEGGGGGGQNVQVHWVGHSLGGIVILCALATATPSLQPYVQSVVTLGSALDYEESAWQRFAPLVPMTRLIPNHDKVVVQPESLTPALLSILQVYPYFLCAEKLTKDGAAALEQCLSPVSMGVMQHLATAIQPGGLAIHPPTAPTTLPKAPPAADSVPSPMPPPSPPGQPQRYLQVMGRVRTPVLALCGDKDVQCGQGAVLRLLEALGSVRRRFVLVGGGGGGGGNGDDDGDRKPPSYGHMDLLLKESAAVDVYPYVCEWVAAAEAGGWGWGSEEPREGEKEGEAEEMKTGEG
jgi:pimeloyl-ACP methyl ester carboxylesterase